jgi:hypothetical protein
LSQGIAHSSGRQQTPEGAPRAPGDGFQEECVQPGKLPAVRSARDADTSFLHSLGPSRHLLRLQKSGRYRSEADMHEN